MRSRIFWTFTLGIAFSLLATTPVFGQEGDTPRDVALLARSARSEHMAFERDVDRFLTKLSTSHALASELLEHAKKNDKEAAAKVIRSSLRPGTEVVVDSIKDAFCIEFTATWKSGRNTYTLHVKIGWC